MDEIRIDDKEAVVMNLVHYFVTEKNYNPVVVHGINDEVWLENMDSNYRIIRIVSRYIHNNEQLGFNEFRSKQIVKKLKLKTFSFKMNTLSIYVNLGDNVELKDDDKNNSSVFIKSLEDFSNNPDILTVFPDIIEKTNHDEKGLELLLKITEDINKTNEKKGKKLDKIFSPKKPYVTYTLMGINILIYIIGLIGTIGTTWLLLGANSGEFVREGEIYRLITSIFLHAGLLHILLNMYSLYIIGPRVEDFFGKWKFLLIYLISGVSGSLLSVMLNDNVFSVGASGAIFGLFGALLYFGYTYRGYVGAMVRSQVVPIVVYNLFISFFIEGIDLWAHGGGVIGGIFAAYALGTIENKKYKLNNIMPLIIYLAFMVYMVFFR